MASIAYLVSIPANFFMAYLGDTVGRKKAIIFLSASSAVSTLCCKFRVSEIYTSSTYKYLWHDRVCS